MLNLCANNYLGLADHPAMIAAAQQALDRWGFGMASVRFICGTAEIHKELEGRIADFLGTEDAILYGSCFDANGGLFETLLGPEDAVISDELNHASIIDGVRLCKASRFRYRNRDMADLEARLAEAEDARLPADRHRRRVLDGRLRRAAGRDRRAGRAHDALVMVDDSHAVGFVGPTGAGTPGTVRRAGSGGHRHRHAGQGAGRGEWRLHRGARRDRGDAAPAVPAVPVLQLARAVDRRGRDRHAGPAGASGELLQRLRDNTAYFRAEMLTRGFEIPESDHPIVPVMIGDAAEAGAMADRLLDEGIYVRAFSFPVVPRGQARIRTQMSAAHSRDDLDRAIAAFVASPRPAEPRMTGILDRQVMGPEEELCLSCWRTPR